MKWKEYWNNSDMVKSSDFCKQVGRTTNKKNYSETQIAILTNRILGFLQAAPEKTLLELACGNGMLTYRVAPHFKSVKAMDFSKPLIEIAKANFARENIEYLFGDAVELDSVVEKYDCILVFAAYQYFNSDQARKMFVHFRRILSPDGRILLGEVADGDRVWSFYRGLTGKWRYYFDLLRGRPIIGQWWKPSDLLKVAEEQGFVVTISYQPGNLPNHYFRYDAIISNAS